MWEHALCRPEHGLTKVISRTHDGQDTDNRRTAVAGRPPYHGLLTDFTRAAHRLLTDCTRARYGRDTGCKRAIHGRLTVGGVERVACRAGASVFVGCSFCVRSLPVWRSSCVGSCGVRARRQIARRITGGSRVRLAGEIAMLHHKTARPLGGRGRKTIFSSFTPLRRRAGCSILRISF